MKPTCLTLLIALLFSATTTTPSRAALAVQDPVINTVSNADGSEWSYLLLEGEDFVSQVNDGGGFIAVDNSESITNSLGSPVLRKLTSASKKGALYGTTIFGEHIDKVTYQVQFTKPGTYYLYMRFTMFENGGNTNHFINEDSFFVPPDFGKDPQTDWPLPRGGYIEGCCDAGFLTINDGGVLTNMRDENATTLAYWEGNFHWAALQTSQFNNPETQGEQRMRIKYEVTTEMLNKPLDFTISYREGGVTIDAFLFSTNPDLLDQNRQVDVDRLILQPVAVQTAANVIGSGENQWAYLILEGENYIAKQNTDTNAGFARVDNSALKTDALGNPILGTNTTASGKGALFTQTVFGEHIDKVTYRVQFASAGTYYLYMRFTMFENGGNTNHFINEDSFFVPPDFGKDPQTDWPLPRGGYIEGCCDGGFLMIEERGVLTERRNATAENLDYWGGDFHWNKLQTSQFNNPETQGEQRMRIKYVVTQEMLNKPLDFTISYREGGVTIDAFLFSTNPDLMTQFNGWDLDHLLINPVSEQNPGNVVGEGETAWNYFVLEGEDYDTKVAGDTSGFIRVDNTALQTSSQGNPILGTNSTASGGGALFTQSIFGEHIDKVTYQVQFASAGTYYLYMRFTMFENGGNTNHYINEDSFFLPPDFGKDPQTDWPLPRGGYVEGCCDGGFLTIEDNGVITNRRDATAENIAYWEGNFHWNKLQTSQFNNPETQGEQRMRIKYEVTPSMVGKPLEFTVSYREGGVTIDSFIFSTDPDLMTSTSQVALDRTVFNISSGLQLTSEFSGGNIVISWPVSASTEGYVLQSANALPAAAADWTEVTAAPVVNGDMNTVSIAPGVGNRFYRLVKP